MWWCPKERFVIFPDEIHISRSMKKFMKKHTLDFRLNRDFADTIRSWQRPRSDRRFAYGTSIIPQSAGNATLQAGSAAQFSPPAAAYSFLLHIIDMIGAYMVL